MKSEVERMDEGGRECGLEKMNQSSQGRKLFFSFFLSFFFKTKEENFGGKILVNEERKKLGRAEGRRGSYITT